MRLKLEIAIVSNAMFVKEFGADVRLKLEIAIVSNLFSYSVIFIL